LHHKNSQSEFSFALRSDSLIYISLGLKHPVDEYHVTIPKEQSCIVDFRQEGLPGVANVNSALREFEPKIVFAWHLSLMLQLEDLVKNGMPSKAEQKTIDDFGEMLDVAFKGDLEQPNALFLARITWNATRELIYRVYDPGPINGYLTQMIDANTSPRPFDYKMEHDPDWKLAQWHLNTIKA
jgi:hypothetical protein